MARNYEKSRPLVLRHSLFTLTSFLVVTASMTGIFSSRKTTVINHTATEQMSETLRLSSTRKHVQPSFRHAHSALWWNANHGRRKQRSIKETDRAARNRKPAKIIGELQPCKSIFFWGGGKAGSTTLARLLKNNHENTTIEEHHVSQFIDLGKEVCWAFNKGGHERWLKLISNKCSSEGHTFALDGCPRYWHPSHARTIVKHYPDARFLMLVRNPIDRLVSHLNDRYGWRGGGAKLPEGFIDKVAKKMAKQVVSGRADDVFGLSLFGRNLRNLLQVVNDPKQVLVIPMDAMKRDPQQVMGNVMDHIGGHRMQRVDAIHANNGKSKGVYEYQFVSDETKKELQEIFTNDVKLLESLLGRTFPWSWTNSTMAEQETSWLTTYPNLQIALSSN
jgi:hypothetical protein